jgi:hypothetical protein
MNVPFEFSVSPGAATPATVKLFDLTNNLILAGIISANPGGGTDNTTKLAKSAGLGAVVTQPAFYLLGLSVTANAACKIEFGAVNNAGSTFYSLYTTFGGEAVAGGIVRHMDTGPKVFHDGSTWHAAIRITPDAGGTVKIAGDVEVGPPWSTAY